MSTRTSDLSINTLMLFHRATDAIAGQEVFLAVYIKRIPHITQAK